MPAQPATAPDAAPTLPESLTLEALQDYVARIVRARGFTTERNEVFILLVEEVGELATELKHRVYYPERFDPQALAFELADVLLYLLDLANGFGLQLAALWPGHETANDARFAQRRGGRPPEAHVEPGFPLNRLIRHVEAKRQERGFEDTPERLVMLLAEEVGEIATEVRKSWKGRGDPQQVGYEIIDALTYLLRLAWTFRVDLEQAVREKERRNAQRTWDY